MQVAPLSHHLCCRDAAPPFLPLRRGAARGRRSTPSPWRSRGTPRKPRRPSPQGESGLLRRQPYLLLLLLLLLLCCQPSVRVHAHSPLQHQPSPRRVHHGGRGPAVQAVRIAPIAKRLQPPHCRRAWGLLASRAPRPAGAAAPNGGTEACSWQPRAAQGRGRRHDAAAGACATQAQPPSAPWCRQPSAARRVARSTQGEGHGERARRSTACEEARTGGPRQRPRCGLALRWLVPACSTRPR